MSAGPGVVAAVHVVLVALTWWVLMVVVVVVQAMCGGVCGAVATGRTAAYAVIMVHLDTCMITGDGGLAAGLGLGLNGMGVGASASPAASVGSGLGVVSVLASAWMLLLDFLGSWCSSCRCKGWVLVLVHCLMLKVLMFKIGSVGVGSCRS